MRSASSLRTSLPGRTPTGNKQTGDRHGSAQEAVALGALADDVFDEPPEGDALLQQVHDQPRHSPGEHPSPEAVQGPEPRQVPLRRPDEGEPRLQGVLDLRQGLLRRIPREVVQQGLRLRRVLLRPVRKQIRQPREQHRRLPRRRLRAVPGPSTTAPTPRSPASERGSPSVLPEATTSSDRPSCPSTAMLRERATS